MCQAVFLCLHFNNTLLEVRQYEERSLLALQGISIEHYGHPDRMHGSDKRVQSIESRIRLGDFFKDASYHFCV